MANIITILRILLSPFLLFLQPLTFSYFALYLALGLSDIIDGIIARKTNTSSKLGALLDSIGDIIFFIVAFITIYPQLDVTYLGIILIVVVFILRVTNILVGLNKEKKLVLLHTKCNKITGLLLFLFPLSLPIVSSSISIPILSLIALYGTLEEGYSIWKRRIEL